MNPFSSTESPLSTPYTVGPPQRSQQSLALGTIISQCFNSQIGNWPDYVQRVGKTNLRTICHGEQVVGGLALYPMGQWFGGQSVPIIGFAAVGIAPEARGSGAAKTLLIETLQELHRQQIPLAALYASTSHLYRTVGFEQAGHYCRYRVPVTHLQPGDRTLPVTPFNPADLDLIRPLYHQQAQANTGNLDRNAAIWQTILAKEEQPRYAYLLGTRSQPQGYVIFSQRSHQGHYDLGIRDRVILTPAAGHRFWTLMADHRSLAQDLYWHGPTPDPLLSLLTEQIDHIAHLERWLLRIVDVAQALTRRGYPAALNAELHFDIIDPTLTPNTGQWILHVANGQGTVTPGGRGDLQLSSRSLAPLYSGFLSAHQLQVLGQVTGNPNVLDLATTLFAGATPWMADHF